MQAHRAADAEWTPLQTCDATGARLQRFCGDAWIAVGDAALSLDPISGQGLFNALYTGLRGAETLLAQLNGQPRALHAYERALEQVRRIYRERLSAAYAL